MDAQTRLFYITHISIAIAKLAASSPLTHGAKIYQFAETICYLADGTDDFISINRAQFDEALNEAKAINNAKG